MAPPIGRAPIVETDNAYVRANKGSINARVSGQVVEIAMGQAVARLNSARLQIGGLKATYRQQLAQLQSTRDSADYNRLDYDRKTALLASDFTSRATFERAQTDLKIAQQAIASKQQQVANTVAALSGDPGIAADRHPTVREAKALLDRARLDLAYKRFLALEDGIVTKVDELQLGDFVTGGAPIFAMLSTDHLWVEANFRETDLTHMRPGQPATIMVDAYPGYRFRAHVASMSPRHGIAIFPAAARERHGQLGQACSAMARPYCVRRTRSKPAAICGHQRHRARQYNTAKLPRFHHVPCTSHQGSVQALIAKSAAALK